MHFDFFFLLTAIPPPRGMHMFPPNVEHFWGKGPRVCKKTKGIIPGDSHPPAVGWNFVSASPPICVEVATKQFVLSRSGGKPEFTVANARSHAAALPPLPGGGP